MEAKPIWADAWKRASTQVFYWHESVISDLGREEFISTSIPMACGGITEGRAEVGGRRDRRAV